MRCGKRQQTALRVVVVRVVGVWGCVGVRGDGSVTEWVMATVAEAVVVAAAANTGGIVSMHMY